MASGNTLAHFEPQANQPPDNGFATLDTITAASGLRMVLDYDDTTDETAIFSSVMPSIYGGGGVTITIRGAMAGANTTDTMSFDAAFEEVIVGGAMGAGGSDFAAANNANVAVDDDADDEFEFTIAFTDGADMDSVGADDAFRLRLTRDADSTTSTDDAVGDFQFLSATIQET